MGGGGGGGKIDGIVFVNALHLFSEGEDGWMGGWYYVCEFSKYIHQ